MKKVDIVYLIYFFAFVLGNNKNAIDNPQLYEVWTIEALEMRIMINNSIQYYADANPEDSIQKMVQNDKIIIIESKKASEEIYELRYGNRGKYFSVNADRVKWILPKKLRGLIMEKNYYYIMDDSYIRDNSGSQEMEYFKNLFSWTNTDIYFSLGSKTIFERAIYRLSSIGGTSIYPSLAFSMRMGNDLLGYPNDSRGLIDFGMMGKIYEIGLQTPIFDIVPDVHRLIAEPKNKSLQGGIGGYGKVSMLGAKIQLSFSEMDNNKLVRERIEDSSYVNYMNLSFLAVGDIYNKPLAKIGHFKLMVGIGYYEISHKILSEDGTFADRTIGRNGMILDDPVSKFAGLMIRSDFITLIKENKNHNPLIQLYSQVNGYTRNKSWMIGAEINYKRIGIDISYKQSVDNVDWAPSKALYASLNYSK